MAREMQVINTEQGQVKLIHEDDNSITLALNYGSNPQQVSNITTIPKCSIKECVEYGKED